MTEDTRDADGRRLGEMSHTNPYTNESFGATQTFTRGRLLAADGGEARTVVGEATEREGEGDEEDEHDGNGAEDETLREVDHTPPRNAPSANPAYMPDDENDER